jgi:hypothetical protein
MNLIMALPRLKREYLSQRYNSGWVIDYLVDNQTESDVCDVAPYPESISFAKNDVSAQISRGNVICKGPSDKIPFIAKFQDIFQGS